MCLSSVITPAFFLAACSDNSGSPTAPSGAGGGSGASGPATPAPGATRVIRLDANLDFGQKEVGQSETRILRIYNNGTGPMTVTGMTVTGGLGGVYVSDWLSGTIAAGTSQAANVTFRPTEARAYDGTLTVNADQTSGSNSMAISGTGTMPAPPPRRRWSHTGTGDSVFDMPRDVNRVRIIGIYNDSSSNFVVRHNGRLVVNEIIGTRSSTRYQGDHLVTGGGVIEIVHSDGVAWSFEELQ